ncbi:radial spoke head protein 6 homolog A [Chironomus tepperi]|uniref:radial spoke head protein 6 homolog A n=1 Tax=Chironomus tepperi TaxID=113505 RepID=UPI00391EFFC7
MTSKMSNDEKNKGSRRSTGINRKTISNQNYRMKQITEVFPSLKKDLQNAKLFLQQSSNESGDSLYEHLSRVITKVIDQRPTNVVDNFELYSERVRLEKFRMQDMRIEVAYKEPDRLTSAQRMLPIRIEEYNQQQQKQRQQMNKYKNEMKSMASTNSDVMDDEEKKEVLEDDEQNDVIYYESPAVKDLCELQFYWNLLGIGFPREETFSLSCAIRKLKTNASISTCRFWGKIFGLKNDYYIAECTLTEDALEKRIDAVEKAINIMSLEPLNPEFSDQQRKSSSNASSMRFESTSVMEKNSEIEKSAVVVATSDDISPVPDTTSNKSETNEIADENKRKEYPTEWNFSMNIPQTSYRMPIEIPAEDIGHGVNRYVYYVCTNLYDEWIELPSATPHQINVSRRIKKYFTGCLDAEILSYPIFPGTERNYLRAIIARISSSTHLAPQKFYEIAPSNMNVIDGNNENDEEEDDEFDEDKCNNDKPIKVNASYHPLSLDKLSKLDYWMHIKPEILKQGRVCYFDGRLLMENQPNDNDDVNDEASIADDDDDENVTEITKIEIRPEMPVPLFTTCSGDRLTNDIISPWTIRLSDVIVESPLVLLQSNIWSGAFAFAKDRICDNIYIGYGHKYTSLNYSPTTFLPQLESEYPHGEVVQEANDPSVDDEKEWQRQQEMSQNNQSSDDDDVSDEVEINN